MNERLCWTCGEVDPGIEVVSQATGKVIARACTGGGPDSCIVTLMMATRALGADRLVRLVGEEETVH